MTAYKLIADQVIQRTARDLVIQSVAPVVAAVPSMALVPFAAGAAAAGMLGMQARKKRILENKIHLPGYYADYRDNPTPLGDVTMHMQGEEGAAGEEFIPQPLTHLNIRGKRSPWRRHRRHRYTLRRMRGMRKRRVRRYRGRRRRY